MNKPFLIFESSPLYLLVCLAIALAISWYFYKKGDYPWSRSVNNTLLVLRTVLLFLLSALLLAPILKYVQQEIEKPVVVFAVDNSTSISEIMDSAALEGLLTELESALPSINSNGFDSKVVSFDGSELEDFADIEFTSTSSNILGLLTTIRDQYEGRNLHSVVLLSDGIYNSGSSPIYPAFGFDLYTLGIGDSIPKQDISIQNLRHNSISYQGNKFPIQVSILNEGFEGQATSLTLFEGNKVLETRMVQFTAKQQVLTEDFLVEASKKGKQRYRLNLAHLPDEFTTANNSRTLFIDVVEGQEKILLLSAQPHPDIKALKEAIESNPNYLFETYIHGVNQDAPTKSKYDLIICHQCTGSEGFISSLTEFDLSDTPMLILYGKQLNLGSLNKDIDAVSLDIMPGEFDSVTPVFNSAFSSFELSSGLQQLMRELPPVIVPFGDISTDYESESLLFQRVGSIETAKPLLIVKSGEPRKAILMGEGIWRWRLHDYLRNDSNVLFDELISKIAQYLSTRNKSQKFKVFAVESETTDQSVVLETEVYNDLFERIVGVPISLQVTDEAGDISEYNYAVSEGNSRYRINGLSSGLYRFKASATVGETVRESQGEFVIKDLQVEYLQLTADFNLLRNLARKNNGDFLTDSETSKLPDYLSADKAKGIIHSFESYNPLINLPWILLLVLILASTEWFLRKYYGTY